MEAKEAREAKEEIKSLLNEWEQNDELKRCLDLYERIGNFLEKKPTGLDKIKTAIKPVEGSPDFRITYKKREIPDCNLEITVKHYEVLVALRDYYGEKIIELIHKSAILLKRIVKHGNNQN
jgi:hypothetical protein